MKTRNLVIALMMSLVLGSGVMVAQPRGVERHNEMRQHHDGRNRIEQRVNAMQKRLMLSDENGKKFAAIYSEYLSELQQCNQPKMQARKAETRTDEQIMKDLKEQIANQQKSADLKAKYFDKLSKVLTARQMQVVFGKKAPKRMAMMHKGARGKNGKMMCPDSAKMTMHHHGKKSENK